MSGTLALIEEWRHTGRVALVESPLAYEHGALGWMGLYIGGLDRGYILMNA